MVSDLHILHSAMLLTDQHDDDAVLGAAQQSDAMLEKGAMAGAATWLLIVKAIEELQRTDKGPGERRISLRDGYPA